MRPARIDSDGVKNYGVLDAKHKGTFKSSCPEKKEPAVTMDNRLVFYFYKLQGSQSVMLVLTLNK